MWTVLIVPKIDTYSLGGTIIIIILIWQTGPSLCMNWKSLPWACVCVRVHTKFLSFYHHRFLPIWSWMNPWRWRKSLWVECDLNHLSLIFLFPFSSCLSLNPFFAVSEEHIDTCRAHTVTHYASYSSPVSSSSSLLNKLRCSSSGSHAYGVRFDSILFM